MLNLINDFFQRLADPNNWTLANITTIGSVIVAIISAVFAYWPIHMQRRTQRFLEENFGADFYDSATIERSTRYYVRPFCSSVDPSQESEIRHLITTQEDLFSAVDKYLADESSYRHILLLADSGMGKTSFVLNYYARNRTVAKRKRQRLAVVPLGIPGALKAIKKIENKKDVVILLDAFDEDTKAIKDYRSRLIEIMQACRQFKRVLITCRTQFFPRDEEIPKETGIAKLGPRKPGESGVYEFWKLYLSPLTDNQVKSFLLKRYGLFAYIKRKKAQDLVLKIPLLSVRPMLLAYIPDLLESGTIFEYSFQIYEQMVEKWLERESHWVDPKALRDFSERLAVDLYVNRQKRGVERISKNEISKMVDDQDIQLDEWKITTRSLLNRDAQGGYKFAHRSIMEYLFVKRFTEGDPNTRNIDWTDYMKRFIGEMLLHLTEQNWELPFSLDGADLEGLSFSSLRADPKELNTGEVTSLLRRARANIYWPYTTVKLQDDVTVIRDLTYKLAWQIGKLSPQLTLPKAFEFLDQMNSSRVCGYNNWRLPTLEELAISLFQMQDSNNPIDSILQYMPEAVLWTADSLLEEGMLVIRSGSPPPDTFALWRYNLLLGRNLHAHITYVAWGVITSGYVIPVRSGFGRY